MRLRTKPPHTKGEWGPECSECQATRESRFIELGEEHNRVYLCFGCILSALETIQPQADEDEE